MKPKKRDFLAWCFARVLIDGALIALGQEQNSGRENSEKLEAIRQAFLEVADQVLDDLDGFPE